MDQELLNQFRHQLALWIEQRLQRERLPFQRLQVEAELLTRLGFQKADFVLWLNQDSHLAGSLILLPDILDKHCLAKAIALAQALGLAHFTTWDAKQINIWRVVDNQAKLHKCFGLPRGDQVTANDFQKILAELLDELKVFALVTTPLSSELGPYYYANLCINHIQELTNQLISGARAEAAHTADDEWLSHAPTEKAWLSLWRILLLLYTNKFPLELQPERFEQAFHYAFYDLVSEDERLHWLGIRKTEVSLKGREAVRVFHLASRLSQLGWPKDQPQSIFLIGLLLDHLAQKIGLTKFDFPWPIDTNTLYIGCLPKDRQDECSLIAPRSYLAGKTLIFLLETQGSDQKIEEELFSLNSNEKIDSAVAVLNNFFVLEKKQREAKNLLLRQVWPNRRFELSPKTSAWIWDAIYLMGLVKSSLTLVLTEAWSLEDPKKVVWNLLKECYQLSDMLHHQEGYHVLRFLKTEQTGVETVKIHYLNNCLTLPASCVFATVGTLQTWMRIPFPVAKWLHDAPSTVAGFELLPCSPIIARGVALFLRSSLGNYLWNLCSNHKEPPHLSQTIRQVIQHGMLIPNEESLMKIGLIGSLDGDVLPDSDSIDEGLNEIFPDIPEITDAIEDSPLSTVLTRPATYSNKKEITKIIFSDGVPLYPEHYVMDLYQSELLEYVFDGPLELSDEFFGQFNLRNPRSKRTFEISNRCRADVLIMISKSGKKEIRLPKDDNVLEKSFKKYQSDLFKLWDQLMGECRRRQPQRQLAIKLAKSIWRQHKLPPIDSFEIPTKRQI
jgi:hypothetical protein